MNIKIETIYIYNSIKLSVLVLVQFGAVRDGSRFGEFKISRTVPIKHFGIIRFGKSQTVNEYFRFSFSE